MTDSPAISVLMPVYNARRYLVEAVQSVLSQSLDDFELIAVDDGSSDGSGRILRRFAGRDRRIRIISRGNTGIVQALNDALKQARGEFLARMDADDVSLPTRFDLQVQFLRAHPEVVAVGSHVELIDPYGVIFPDKWQPRLALEHDGIEADLLRGNGWALIHPSVMMRRADVEAIGGYRREFQHAEDIDLYLRLAERGKVANLPEVLHRYRQHLGSVNRVHRDRQIEIITAIMKDAHQRRGTTMPPNWKLEWPEMPGRWKQHCDWAWHALKSGQAPAARKHALNALRAEPLNRDSWRLIFCAIRGR